MGKTTLAYALGLAAAAAGKRVIVCEIASQQRGSELFGRKRVGFEETRLDKRLWTLSIDPDLMVLEYLQVQAPLRAMGTFLHRSRLFAYLAAATPGLAEMVTMGKVWELGLNRRKAPGAKRTYDLVIVDAPATGHGVGFLQTPRNFREMARVGPLAQQASRIEATISDHDQTGIAIVARAEEMAVNESIELESALLGPGDGAGAGGTGFSVDRIYVNGLYPQRFSVDERELIGRLPALGTVALAVAAAAAESDRAASQREQLERLRGEVRSPLTELPFVFAPRIGVEQLRDLARAAS